MICQWYKLKLKDFFYKYKKAGYFVTIIFLLILMLYKALKSPAPVPPSEAKVVAVAIAKRGAIKQIVETIGTVKSSKHTTLTAMSKGILTILAKSGQRVKKGDLIATVENQDIEKNYKILYETAVIAHGRFKRAQHLLKAGVASKNIVEEKKSILLDSQKKLSDAKIALEELKIYAPFDGVIGFFKVRGGAQVATGEAIVTFYDPQSLLVDFNVSLEVMQQVRDGASVFVNDQEYRLTHIQRIVDEETHMCPAYVEVRCPECVIGAAIEVKVVVGEDPQAIIIPFIAVFLRNTKPFVYVVRDNKIISKAVKLGIRDKERVAVKSGVTAGDQVVIQGQNHLYPGALVTTQEQRSAP